ncbi:hypothetical protein Pla144_16040 [Bythopirellula polymerisocia]|uniref:Uncharacterized protein n=2 Tax=Bythopirellula polymerisocia TaxID=2528003 RepID=A0A5C6CXQ7_9BACT|nr:hypothetical protein Pla144_16040 [Bythopirellula polymerisocia]
MVYALALLLFSSLTCVGLLAIWAATSPHHWFWRTMLFLGVMSLVLLIPAYEPFVAFVLQGMVVATAVQLARWWEIRKHKVERTGARFGIRTNLLAMVPVAVLSAVAVRLPALNFPAWQSVLLIGVCAGVATLTGLWIARGKSVRWWLRLPIGVFIVGVLSLVLMAGDWSIAATHSLWGWPPPVDDGSGYSIGYDDYHQEPAWIAIISLLIGIVALVQSLLIVYFSLINEGQGQTAVVKRGLIVATLLILGSVLLAPPAGTYYELMNPLPIPEADLPNPNGYDDFLAAVNLLPGNMIVNGGNFDTDTATLSQLRAAESEMRPAIERMCKGLSKSILGQVDYTSDDLWLESIQQFRSIARGMSASSKLAGKERDYTEAAAISLDLIQFGIGIGRGRLMIDTLVGNACTGIGCHDLYHTRDKTPVEQCLDIASGLARIENDIEPLEDVVYRDRIWTQHTQGWHAHLMQFLEAVSEESFWSSYAYYNSDRRNRAVLRLLQLEFALRAWKAEHHEWPESLAELVPAIIPAVPIDPFSPDGKPLQYVRIDDGFVLYSVGQNEIDEGGTIPDDDGSGYRDPATGDLRLDIHYAPDPPVNAGSIGDKESVTEEETTPSGE